MDDRDTKLIRDIRKLAEEKNAVVLAHNYQRYEVQKAADLFGDSLGLSRQAAGISRISACCRHSAKVNCHLFSFFPNCNFVENE